MIIINGKNFDNASKKVSFGEYNVTQDGKKRKGKSPFISFKLDNICLGLETTYDIEWLKKLTINDKKDISKYISDITYEDEKGWISLILGNYKCFISKVDDNIFDIEFNCNVKECAEYFDILIIEKINIEYI